MKNISKYKVDTLLLIALLILVGVSLIMIYSSQTLLPSYMQNLALKQLIWYILGFGLVYLIMTIRNEFIYRNIWFLYGFGVLSLIALLIWEPY